MTNFGHEFKRDLLMPIAVHFYPYGITPANVHGLDIKKDN
jgi:hypothetical protein